MNRCTTCLLSAALLVPGAQLFAQDDGLDDDIRFRARLSGAQEPVPSDAPSTPSPGVSTETSGDVQVVFERDLSSMTFRLEVLNGVAVTAAHLHCAPAGVNGPIVVFLTDPAQPEQDVNGVLGEGTRVNTDIQASAAGCEALIGRPVRNIASLADAAFRGLIYANVHTAANPSGEIRGQLIIDDDDGLDGLNGGGP